MFDIRVHHRNQLHFWVECMDTDVDMVSVLLSLRPRTTPLLTRTNQHKHIDSARNPDIVTYAHEFFFLFPDPCSHFSRFVIYNLFLLSLSLSLFLCMKLWRCTSTHIRWNHFVFAENTARRYHIDDKFKFELLTCS